MHIHVCVLYSKYLFTGICLCDYGMVMSAQGCSGLQYIPSQSNTETSLVSAPTLGFWAYAAIIGGVILAAAIILVVVHALFSIRPVQLDTMRVSCIHNYLQAIFVFICYGRRLLEVQHDPFIG